MACRTKLKILLFIGVFGFEIIKGANSEQNTISKRLMQVPDTEIKNVKRSEDKKDETVVFEKIAPDRMKRTEVDSKPVNLNIPKSQQNLGFFHGFAASISVIVVSELGDKTFFIAAIMAMKYARVTVFSGAISALGLMTILSAYLGFATTIIPRWITYYFSTLLFAIFGLRMLKEGIAMSPDEGQEELEEVQAELKKKDEEMEREATSTLVEDPESGIVRGGKRVKRWGFISPILFQAFTLTFLAEWGDRSQLTTIILGARENVLGVIIGGTIGHALCTGLAVIGGRMIAQRISVRTVTIIGGVVFLIFALSSLILSPEVGS